MKKLFIYITIGVVLIFGLTSCNNSDTNTDVTVDSTK
jgi:hypothetical protein